MIKKHNIELIKHLTLREIKARYKQSFLGFFWIILNPFFQMIIMSFIFSQVMKMQYMKIPYPIFLYSGLLPWLFFGNSLSHSMSSLVQSSSLIKKIYFPREALIISTIVAKLFDFALASIVFILLMIFFQVKVSPIILLFFPIFFIQLIFTTALSLLLSMGNLLYRDVQYLFDLVLNLWFYMTPIIYGIDFFPAKYRLIFKLNPMAVFIDNYRRVILLDSYPNWTDLGIASIISIVFLIIVYRIFKKAENIFADVV